MHITRIHYSKYFQGQLLGSCLRHWEMAQAVAAVNDISVTYDILRLQWLCDYTDQWQWLGFQWIIHNHHDKWMIYYNVTFDDLVCMCTEDKHPYIPTKLPPFSRDKAMPALSAELTWDSDVIGTLGTIYKNQKNQWKASLIIEKDTANWGERRTSTSTNHLQCQNPERFWEEPTACAFQAKI